MKEIKSPVKSEQFQACVLINKNNEVAWCVYHPDDGGDKLIFTRSLIDIEDIEHFKNTTEEEIIAHLNKNGFEIEPEEDFGDVIIYKNLPDEYKVKLIDVQLNKMFSINFKL